MALDLPEWKKKYIFFYIKIKSNFYGTLGNRTALEYSTHGKAMQSRYMKTVAKHLQNIFFILKLVIDEHLERS